MFIGRYDELNNLKKLYKTNRTEMIAVLGRRRVGKSQLIFESHKNFDGIVISYQCSDIGYKENFKNIVELIRTSLGNKYLNFENLTDVLLFLEAESKKKSILFIIDEYPYLRNGKDTDCEIKNGIDQINLDGGNNPFKFILCGSSVQVMETLDDANMPLHGRFTHIIRLMPLNYLDASLMMGNTSYEDKISYYSVFGGVPYFLKQINTNLTFDENVKRLFISEDGLLRLELANQINGEINKIEKATYILNVMRNKLVSYTDIKQRFNASFPNTEIDYPLSKLLKMKVIEKINIHQDNGKIKAYYRIIDNALKFYYSFLNENFSNRLLFTDEQYYDEFIKDKLHSSFIPLCFEDICKEFLSLMNKNRLLDDILFDLYVYIVNDKTNKENYQFDVVGETKDNKLINYECKYKNQPINSSLVENENKKSLSANMKFYKTVFISKSKVNTNEKVYYLDDLFNEKLFQTK